MKKQSMKISQYFQVLKPKYLILKVIPDTSIRNYNSSNIAKTINFMYKGINQRINWIERKFVIKTPVKVAFFIDIRKSGVDFYFIVPEQYYTLVKEKITETWPKATVDQVDNIEMFSDSALKYQLRYSKEDALSLDIDKRSNEPLNGILNVLDVMEEGDRVGIFYNFLPIWQRGWRKEYNETIDKIKQNMPIDKEKFNKVYIVKVTVIFLLQLIQYALEVITDFLGAEIKKDESLMESVITTLIVEDRKKLSSSTIRKKDSIVISTQMVVISDSQDNIRQMNNAVAVAESYKAISDDNELIYKRVKKGNVVFTDYSIKNVDTNKLSVEECQNLLQIPGRDLLEAHKIISHINVLESEIPKSLQNGVMCIGDNTYKGFTQRAYLSVDKEYKNLTLCLIGPTRAGKTTLIANLSKDGVSNEECTIIFDFCGNCDLSEDVSRLFSRDKVLNIDCSDYDNIQGLGYNEVQSNNNNPFEVYKCAKTKTNQLMTLINSINSNDNELKSRMERYLEAAAVVVFLLDGSIRDVFEVLQNHILRHKYISLIPSNLKENTKEYVSDLEELDEWSKPSKDNPPEVTGTRLSIVQGILNRVSKLKQNAYMELMLKKDCSNNINLIDEMQKSQLICIKMPEVMFSTEQEKDIYCTYWLTKIWGALQKRRWNYPNEKDRKKVNIVFDELYQVPNCQDFLRTKLSQIAKYGGKSIISCHYLGQIGIIRNELKAANTSYMLISGCDKDNFKELKEELYPYTLDDLLNLKRYHSLNLIKYEDGWAKFITKLPPPVK